MAAQTRVVFHDAAMNRMMRDDTGPLAMRLRRIGFMVEAEAKSLASGRLVNVQTGRLAGSISSRVVSIGGVLVAIIGTNVEYARYVHEGTRPHVIRPKRATILRFTVGGRSSRSGGSVVFARQVNHPGTKPRPFLVQALRAVR